MFKTLIGKVVMVRTYSAGVHFGTILNVSEDGKIAGLENTQRVWRWSGAASLSQLSQEGSSNGDCKLAMALPQLILTECIEFIPMSDMAITNLKNIEPWKV